MFRLNLKSSIRVLLKNRVFSIVVIVTFAATIGVNATIFSLRDAILERTLPVDDAEDLVGIFGTVGGEAGDGRFNRMDYLHCKEHLKGVSELAAHYSSSPMILYAEGIRLNISGSAVSANFFSLMRLTPVLGRFFLPEDDVVGSGSSVVVLSHILWNREFGADPNIVGKQIRLNRVNFTVIGVAPANFRGVNAAGDANQLWVPLSSHGLCDVQRPICRFLNLVGRLAKGNSVKQLQAEMDVLAPQLIARSGSTIPAYLLKGRILHVLPQRGVAALHRSELTRFLGLLTNAALLLIFIACVNVSGLFLVHMAARMKEMILRVALGSNRRQLYFQLLTEAGILCLLGGVGGVLIAHLLSGPVSRWEPFSGRHYYSDVRINTSLILFTAVLVTLCTIIVTIIPVIRLYRSDLLSPLKGMHSGGSSRTSRIHDAIIVAQVALSLALVAGGGLFVVSLRTIQRGPGFDLSHQLTFRVRPELIETSTEKTIATLRAVSNHLSTLPGVGSVSLGVTQPFFQTNRRAVSLPGRMPDREEEKFRVQHNIVGPKYLETLQIPLVSGREFNDSDNKESQKVVIINQSLANRMFPNENAVGKALAIDSSEYTVIGVSKDAQYHTLSITSVPYFYLPFWQLAERRGGYFCLRTAGDPKEMIPVIAREMMKIDPNWPPGGIYMMDEALKVTFPSVYMGFRVFSSASAIACFLSMLGLYSITAFSVIRRSREIGIRIALGATRWKILRIAIQRGVVLTATGAVLGIGLSIAGLRLFDSMLYGVRPTNPTVLIAATIALLSFSLIAGLIPARRATRIDPIKAIRDE